MNSRVPFSRIRSLHWSAEGVPPARERIFTAASVPWVRLHAWSRAKGHAAVSTNGTPLEGHFIAVRPVFRSDRSSTKGRLCLDATVLNRYTHSGTSKPEFKLSALIQFRAANFIATFDLCKALFLSDGNGQLCREGEGSALPRLLCAFTKGKELHGIDNNKEDGGISFLLANVSRDSYRHCRPSSFSSSSITMVLRKREQSEIAEESSRSRVLRKTKIKQKQKVMRSISALP